jgi:N-acetylglucosaminyldiphosphoundecaprenol N-acetyl-beta-D-mannosaminyltransferase
LGIGFEKYDVLGVKICAIDLDDACKTIEDSIRQKKKAYVSVCPVSTIMSCQESRLALDSVNSADLATPDGMPVVWVGKFLRGRKNVGRVYGPDLMQRICAVSEKAGYKHYFYGSSQKVLEELQKRIKIIFPGLTVSGAYSPAFEGSSARDANNDLELINKSGADIVWVGLGSPKQDIWMYQNRDKLCASVLIGVGAAFDFLAGTKKQAPGWMQKSGFEWLFRLAQEPGRLWKRYIIGNSLFLYLLCKEFARKIKEGSV